MVDLSPTAIAELRGEALAGQLMAAAAIRLLLAVSRTDSKQAILTMSSFIDQTLNSGGSPEQNEELDAIMRETARRMIDQHLAAIPQQR